MKHQMLLAVLALPVVLPAFGHGGDPSVVHACVHRSSGNVRIVAPIEDCRLPEMPLHLRDADAQSSGGPRGVQLFQSDGTFAVPAGVTSVLVEAWGAGGGAGLPIPASMSVRGGGGGGGGYLRAVAAVVPGSILPVTIGQGGSATCGADGGIGGDTSFGGLLVARGGRGGTAAGQGGTGGVPDATGMSVPGSAATQASPGQGAQGSFATAPFAGSVPPGRGGIDPRGGFPGCDVQLQEIARGRPGQLIVQW